MTAIELLSDRPSFQTRNGETFFFGQLAGKNNQLILAWNDISDVGNNRTCLKILSILRLTEETLRKLDLWEKLGKIQDRIKQLDKENIETKKLEDCQKMEHARKHRNTYSEEIPRKLICACGFETSIGPGLLLKKAESLGKTWQELVKEYKCRRCIKDELEK